MPATPLSSRIIAFAKTLDLGRKMGGELAGCCAPSSEKYYPTVWIDRSKEPIDLPDSGKATVEYKVVRRSTETRDGQTTHDASLEIRSITPEEPKKDAKPKNTATMPIKLGAKSPLLPFSASPLLPRIITFARSRNTDGQFAPETAESGITPETTAKAYGAFGEKPSLLSKAVGPAVAGGTTAGAALLARALLKKKGR